ncbi:MAG TPA: hypothetical protein VGW74_03260, partial [Propionibacteriaceae bacterium]|nr:hypothetical protein [Propionibacteriaceae bacterium]
AARPAKPLRTSWRRAMARSSPARPGRQRRQRGHRPPARGEVPVAVVVPRPGAEPGPDELLAWVADAIPRTPSGKLLRRAVG